MTTISLSKLKAVYFDMGSTLIYYSAECPGSFDLSADPLVNFLHEQGIHFNDAAFKKSLLENLVLHVPVAGEDYREQTAASTMTRMLEGCGCATPSPIFVHQALRQMYDVSERIWKPEADSLPLLQELKARGYRIGVISNTADDENVQRLVDLCGYRPYLDLVLTSAGFGYGKPGERIFRYALDQFGVTGEEAIMIGDTPEADILGANRVGMKNIWITRRARTIDPITLVGDLAPWRTVSTLAEVTDILPAEHR